MPVRRAAEEWVKWRANYAAPNTIRSQALVLQQFIARHHASRLPVAHLSFEHYDLFVNAPDGTGISTRRFRLATVRSFSDFLVAKGYNPTNPGRLVRIRLRTLTHAQKEPTPRVPFSQREYAHVVAHTTGFWKWATALGYWAGLRLSDIACLEWGSILPDEIIVWTRKSGARVALPISNSLIGGGELRPIIFELLEQNRHPQYVFPAERDVMLDPARRASLSVRFSRLLAALGIEGKSFHCLRHSFCTRLATAGKTLEQIGRYVGHASTCTTARYVHK